MSAVPSCAIDFYGPDTIADPVTAYHKMLSLGPIVRLEPLGMTAICGHAAERGVDIVVVDVFAGLAQGIDQIGTTELGRAVVA